MKKLIIVAALLACTNAYAQSATGDAKAESGSNSGANAYAGGLTLINPSVPTHQRVDTTPPVYAATVTHGASNHGCGQGGGIGGSMTGAAAAISWGSESKPCNTRADAESATRLGFPKVAEFRMFCFGSDENRFAYEAAGNKCPEGSTAKSLAQNIADSRPGAWKYE